ncbi:hypothetical protein [Sorangium sp. So ce426]|uniref:hypothetical protein n=1 Tax=Sorangium sp. So ce426 TaxID=3133312 RepID=UPI003F5C2004
MMSRSKALFICGSINQTTQMHQIARELPEVDAYFTPYYGDRDVELLRRLGALEGTIGGNKLRGRCLDYLREHGLPVDDGGRRGDYDLVLHCSDLVWPSNITGKNVVLVQEGMTDPESILFPLVKRLPSLPRWLAGTSATGLSDRYTRFCVASPGYRDLFVRRGVRPEKIVVTGIPNFDDCTRYRDNNFPFRHYVLVCTSDIREVFWYEDREKFIRKARSIAAGRPLLFKLHPNEKVSRAVAEISRFAPEASVFTGGCAEHMVANCDVLICQYSSLAHVGLALGKEVHSFFDLDELRRLLPLQHGRAARNIADVCRALLAGEGRAARGPSAAADAPAAARGRRRGIPARTAAGEAEEARA